MTICTWFQVIMSTTEVGPSPSLEKIRTRIYCRTRVHGPTTSLNKTMDRNKQITDKNSILRLSSSLKD